MRLNQRSGKVTTTFELEPLVTEPCHRARRRHYGWLEQPLASRNGLFGKADSG